MTENPQQPGGPAEGAPQGQGASPYDLPQQQPYPGMAPGTTPGTTPAGSKYGTSAYDPAALGGDMAEPRKLGLLRTLTLASLAVYVLGCLVGLLLAGNEAYLDAQLESQAGLGMTSDQLEEFVAVSMVIVMVTTIVLLVIGVVLYLVVFFGLKRGKNWARILGTVLAALGIGYGLVTLIGVPGTIAVAPGIGIATLVFAVALVAVNIWWIIAAFSGEVNAYMRARAGR